MRIRIAHMAVIFLVLDNVRHSFVHALDMLPRMAPAALNHVYTVINDDTASTAHGVVSLACWKVVSAEELWHQIRS